MGEPALVGGGRHRDLQRRLLTISLAAPASQVPVVLTNHDLFRHTFTIDQLHVHLEAPPGQHPRGELRRTNGACRAHAHAAAGMRGTLTIH